MNLNTVPKVFAAAGKMVMQLDSLDYVHDMGDVGVVELARQLAIKKAEFNENIVQIMLKS